MTADPATSAPTLTRAQLIQLLRHTQTCFGDDLPFAVRIETRSRRSDAAPTGALDPRDRRLDAQARSAGPRPRFGQGATAGPGREADRAARRPPRVAPPPQRKPPVRRRPSEPDEATKAPKPAAELPPIELPDDLDGQRQKAVGCRRCKLCETRSKVVFGEGDPDADVMFVGEAPGAREDEQGRPFVGPAGQLLTRMIEGALGMPRRDVYIANVNKCRPPRNRNPEPDEVAACMPFLKAQIRAVRPKVLIALGRVAAANLLGDDRSVTRLRGFDLEFEGTPVVVSWHPAYLLRQPDAKRDSWEDLKRVNRLLGRPEVPEPYKGR